LDKGRKLGLLTLSDSNEPGSRASQRKRKKEEDDFERERERERRIEEQVLRAKQP